MPGGAHVQQVIIVSKSPESPPDPPVDGADLQVLVLLRDLTDGLTSGLGPVDVANLLLEGCLRHTACHHAGIMLADPAGRLHVLASSSEDARNLELLELQADEGPCLDAYRLGRRVSSSDLGADAHRWPRFAAAADDAGMHEVHSIPMRLGDRTIGALNIFMGHGRSLAETDLPFCEILAGAATLGIVTRDRLSASAELAGQLQNALDSRTLIEQAKGVVAARTGFDMGRSFELLRAQARHERRPLREVAQEMVRQAGALSS